MKKVQITIYKIMKKVQITIIFLQKSVRQFQGLDFQKSKP